MSHLSTIDELPSEQERTQVIQPSSSEQRTRQQTPDAVAAPVQAVQQDEEHATHATHAPSSPRKAPSRQLSPSRSWHVRFGESLSEAPVLQAPPQGELAAAHQPRGRSLSPKRSQLTRALPSSPPAPEKRQRLDPGAATAPPEQTEEEKLRANTDLIGTQLALDAAPLKDLDARVVQMSQQFESRRIAMLDKIESLKTDLLDLTRQVEEGREANHKKLEKLKDVGSHSNDVIARVHGRILMALRHGLGDDANGIARTQEERITSMLEALAGGQNKLVSKLQANLDNESTRTRQLIEVWRTTMGVELKLHTDHSWLEVRFLNASGPDSGVLFLLSRQESTHTAYRIDSGERAKINLELPGNIYNKIIKLRKYWLKTA